MKILFKKIRKSNLGARLVYFFISILFISSYIDLFLNLIKLSGIETTIRIIVLTVIGFILFMYLFFGLILLISKHNKTVFFASFVVMLISAISIIGSSFISKAFKYLNNMQKDTILYTTNLITLKDTKYDNSKSFKVGIFSNTTDTEGNVLPLELIKKDNLQFTVSEYDTYFEMLEKLYNKELDGIFITSNYNIVYGGYDAYKNIDTDVKVALEYSKELENQDFIESNASVDKPFTLLLMGVDSTSNKLNANAGFNGDTLMLITFNPHTLNATFFSIPRDTYVPIACLKNGGSSKINSSAAYGSSCVINTIQNLTGINIDYYVKINFKGVVKLVDALGGINITVPDKMNFCEQDSNRCKKKECLLCIKPGYQHMNGEQALAFARHRKTLPGGDFTRVQNQQLVVEAIANSAKNLSSVNDFYALLEAISDNIDTNMQTKEMLNLYNVGKQVLANGNFKDGIGINIQKTYLTGYDLMMYVNNIRARVYTFQYYEQSLNEIVDALKVNLELKQPEIIKTFNFSVNDTYKVPIIGKKYYTVQRNETVPDFVAKNVNEVQEWCGARNIIVNINYITKGMMGYSDLLSDGYVVSQSVKRGVLVKDTPSISISVIKKESTTTVPEHTDTGTTTTTTTTTTVTTTTSVITTQPTTETTTVAPTLETQNNE